MSATVYATSTCWSMITCTIHHVRSKCKYCIVHASTLLTGKKSVMSEMVLRVEEGAFPPRGRLRGMCTATPHPRLLVKSPLQPRSWHTQVSAAASTTRSGKKELQPAV